MPSRRELKRWAKEAGKFEAEEGMRIDRALRGDSPYPQRKPAPGPDLRAPLHLLGFLLFLLVLAAAAVVGWAL